MDNKVKELIQQLETKVAKLFGNDKTGHNIGHLKRTLKYALKLQEKEGGDIKVIAVASFVHDVHRLMQDELKRYVQPVESLLRIRELITDLNLTTQQKEHICYAVEHHEEYAFGKGVTVQDIETLIVQDADNLDAIGAIGLMRTIQFSTAKNIPIWEPLIPLYQNKYDETTLDVSSMHHVHNKLLRLGKHMNTKTAKELAKPKNKLMYDFLKIIIDEWE